MNIFAVTLGCKVNQYESQAIVEFLEESGYKAVDSRTKADIIILNSCTVTARSDQKVRQTCSKLKRENPNAILVLMGCMPQAFPDKAKKINEADIILGSFNKKYVLYAIKSFIENNNKIFNVYKNSESTEFENLKVSNFFKRTRAFLKIEDGCEQFCSYCIVPFARGKIRSKKIDDILSEAKKLSNSGYKEIVLTGINLSCYGKDCGVDLSDAIEAVCSIEGIERVKLSSLEPNIVTDKFLEKISSQTKLCPAFHLSMQSGCDRILKIMNRNYLSSEYSKIVEKLRKIFDNPSITTDILVGFPSETDKDFMETKEFVRKMKFSKAHIFKYSRRPMTKSYEMKDDVDVKIKNKRSAEITEIIEESAEKFIVEHLNKTASVLFESSSKDGFATGLSSNCIKVTVKSSRNICGKILDVDLLSVKKEGNFFVARGSLR
ncbi:MAG: tRNA (N(6)-L-threonylcarbamoyladenosine(37)-C(2))-methylthiotransferase MtaB [Oscillospiraceae bacterium]|nr:tRNA (N(6)-L-threonylcarbamoyladenosine(37)-C(2))-methylthiotransferase MtaB [Oscillospiraceae bacterium]